MPPQDKMTIAQFAEAIKKRDPRLKDVPDDVLVRKVLERRPEMRSRLVTEEPRRGARPPAPEKPFTQQVSDYFRRPEGEKPFVDRVGARLQESIAGFPKGISESIEQRGKEGREALRQGDYWGYLKGAFGAPTDIARGVVGGIYGLTPPGLVERMVNREDPANIAADALMMFPFGEAEPLEVGAKAIRGAGRATIGAPLQELAGAGREPVFQARVARESALRDLNMARGADVEKAAQKFREADANWQQKVRQDRAEWVQKAYRAREAERATARYESQKQTLSRGQTAGAERLLENVKDTFGKVKKGLDTRWDDLRKTPMTRGGAPTILKDELLDSKRISSAVEKAERDYLQGAPESVKQFRDLMKWMEAEGAGAVGEESGGAVKRLRPITWDEARTHYTALGDRMFSGDLPGNVRKAIAYVRNEGLGEQLRAGAERFGALPVYEGLLNDWSNFESDWKDTSSVGMRGGSPLAKAVKAPSAAYLIPQLTGKDGDLLMQRLGRYRNQGASINLAEGVRKLGTDIKNLEKPGAIPKAPGRLELPPAPTFEPPPYRPSPARLTPAGIRNQELLNYARRPFRFWDLFPPSGGMHAALKFPAIRELLSRIPRNELRVTPEAVEAFRARQGKPEGLTPGRPPAGAPAAPVVPPGPAPRTPGAADWLKERAAALTPAERLRMAQDNLNSLRMRQIQNPGDYNLVTAIRAAEETLKTAQDEAAKAAFGPGAASAPKAVSRQGGGGLNYSAEELDALKKKWGIQ